VSYLKGKRWWWDGALIRVVCWMQVLLLARQRLRRSVFLLQEDEVPPGVKQRRAALRAAFANCARLPACISGDDPHGARSPRWRQRAGSCASCEGSL
jgi:hypothetical protein